MSFGKGGGGGGVCAPLHLHPKAGAGAHRLVGKGASAELYGARGEPRIQLLDDLVGDLALLLVGDKNDARVLSADVVALPVLGGGVVEGEEVPHELLVADLRGVKLHRQHLHVAGRAAADLVVAWVGLGARRAHEADSGLGERTLELAHHEGLDQREEGGVGTLSVVVLTKLRGWTLPKTLVSGWRA